MVIGYSFSDRHINEAITGGRVIPSDVLVISGVPDPAENFWLRKKDQCSACPVDLPRCVRLRLLLQERCSKMLLAIRGNEYGQFYPR